ncbi:hypothetical protein RR48_02249 [Papilio machaon]|uniref:Uncharacterized protein n=1 Tax=Papilio machaon TaxID=76193 RepID=A0A0N1I8E2_PAPMA|nr:hypothetical protein RR48_02249 [Papilio machaon]
MGSVDQAMYSAWEYVGIEANALSVYFTADGIVDAIYSICTATKKFYTARTELKRMQELCQKQHRQMKEYQKVIKHLESKLANQTKQLSPFNVPISPSNNLSPGFLQSTPTYKRTAKSTPYSDTKREVTRKKCDLICS